MDRQRFYLKGSPAEMSSYPVIIFSPPSPRLHTRPGVYV